MEMFTYQEYLKYKYLFGIWEKLKKEKQGIIYSTLMEEKEEYILGTNNENHNRINNEHDKIFRTLFNKKTDVAIFINKFLKQDIKAEELERYNSSFINIKFENREADVV